MKISQDMSSVSKLTAGQRSPPTTHVGPITRGNAYCYCWLRGGGATNADEAFLGLAHVPRTLVSTLLIQQSLTIAVANGTTAIRVVTATTTSAGTYREEERLAVGAKSMWRLLQGVKSANRTSTPCRPL
jgi:hypothetical protein